MDFSTLNNKNSKNDGDFCPHRFLEFLSLYFILKLQIQLETMLYL